MEASVGQKPEAVYSESQESSEEYRDAVKRLIDTEVRNIIDEEIKKASQELLEEQRKAIRQVVEEHQAAIRAVVEEEKKAIWGRVEELRKSIMRLGMG